MAVSSASAQGRALPKNQGPSPKPPRRRYLKLVLIALPFLGLALLELGLRVAHYGYPTSFLLPAQVQDQPVWIENRRFGWQFFPKKIARAPQPMVVPQAKPPGTIRIVVLGESAALGDPEPAYGFSRYLEVMLQEAFPNQTFEVVNAAMTAINSHGIRLIARDCAKLDADFWVLYIGNNEVVGPFGSGTVFGARAPSLGLIRASLYAQNFKVVQLGHAVRQRLAARRAHPEEWGGLEMFLENKVRYDSPQMEVVYAHFTRNLEDILNTGRRAGAKLLVATVAANLKDCPPFASLNRADLPEDSRQQWNALVQEGITQAAAGRPQEALKQWQAALDLDKDYAEVEWRVAEAQRTLGQLRGARVSYQAALDLDALRFRVDGRLNEITRRLAGGQTNAGTYLVDGERAVARASAQQVPGRELFWDHVHLNFQGNHLLARAVAEQVAQLLPAPSGRPERPRWLSAGQASERLALTDWDRLQVTTEMRRRLQRPPFTQQINHTGQLAHARQLEADLKPRATGEALKAQLKIYQTALAARPADPVLLARQARLLEAAGDLEGALAQWQAAAVRLPHYVQAIYSQGSLLRALGRRDAAVERFQQALQLLPDCAEAWNGLALCDLDAGRVEEAIAGFQRALREQPRDADFHYNLGIALGRQGQTNASLACYERALEIAPEHTSARFNLANKLFQLGRLADAEQHLSRLLQEAPEHARARNNHGLVLLRLGRPAEALAQFREAVRQEPDNLEARLNLAGTMMAQKQYAEAIPHWEAILARHPNLAAARQKLEDARRLRDASGGRGAP